MPRPDLAEKMLLSQIDRSNVQLQPPQFMDPMGGMNNGGMGAMGGGEMGPPEDPFGGQQVPLGGNPNVPMPPPAPPAPTEPQVVQEHDRGLVLQEGSQQFYVPYFGEFAGEKLPLGPDMTADQAKQMTDEMEMDRKKKKKKPRRRKAKKKPAAVAMKR